MVVFDVTSKESFDHVEVWLNEAKLYAIKSEPVILLIGNKVDKPVSFLVAAHHLNNYLINCDYYHFPE